MSYIEFCNTIIEGKNFKELTNQYLITGAVDYSFKYRRLLPYLQEVIPHHLIEYNIDTPLSRDETEKLKKLVEDDLLNMIRDKPESPEDSYDTFRILGRSIELDLQGEEGKIIHSLNSVVEVLADCLEQNKPAYFSYDAEPWGNSNYKGLRKDKWIT